MEELRAENARLGKLLADPAPGIGSWYAAVAQSAKRVAELAGWTVTDG